MMPRAGSFRSPRRSASEAKVDRLGIREPNERAQAVAWGRAPQQPKPAHQDRVVPRSAVRAEVAGHDPRRGLVVVEHEIGDRVAALLRIVSDEALDGPEAHLGVLVLGVVREIARAPDPMGHSSCSPRSRGSADGDCSA